MRWFVPGFLPACCCSPRHPSEPHRSRPMVLPTAISSMTELRGCHPARARSQWVEAAQRMLGDTTSRWGTTSHASHGKEGS